MLEKIYRSNGTRPNTFLATAGESFSVNKTYFVRYGVRNGETMGRVYKATKLDPDTKSFYVIGCIQTDNIISAGDKVLVIEAGEVILRSNDTNLSNGTDGGPIFLGDAGSFTSDTPEVGLAPNTRHQAVLLGEIKVVGGSSTGTTIKLTPIVNAGEHLS